MAIYHLSSSVISRSQGRSAVACASYRSAEMLHDEKYGKTHDYSRKQDVFHAEILLPENAPEWMKDREKLWNGVEASEKRKDAQLAREVQFSLPRELTHEQNIYLAREFIQRNFVDRGMIADWAFHLDKTTSGESQPHVHVMLTMREITPEGFGQKVREWNRKEELLLWRESWAETANRNLSLHGHDIQIDHRSNAERGISLEPQHKIGASVASHRMARLEDHQRITRENGEKIFLNPSIALDALTKQQSTFTHQDLARFIHRHTADAEQFQQVYDKVKGCQEMIFLSMDEDQRERFTTQAMLSLETGMISNANQLMERQGYTVQENSKSSALGTRTLTDQQKAAFLHLTEKGNLKCVVGYAGSGKSYLLGAAREAWEKEGYRVLGATLSGIAAETLEGSSGIASRTLASRFYYWDKGEQILTAQDVLVVDEAGMIGSRQMAKIIEHAQRQGAKVVLVGDPEQLQAIDAGAAFRALSEQSGFVELTEIRRQVKEWQREATREFAQGLTQEALTRYKNHDHVHEFETQAMAKKAVVEQWNDVRIVQPEKTQIMLAYTRKDVQELNEMARDTRRSLGELGEDHALQTARGEKLFAERDRVYFLQNDRDMGVKNGTLGTLLRIEGQLLTVQLDKGEDKSLQTVTVDLEKYNHIDHGYAATIHKSQGVTVDRAYLLASRHMDRHAAYVGMSRHRETADLFYSREEFPYERSLAQTLGRDRGKDVTVDYTQESLSLPSQEVKEIKPDLMREFGFTADDIKAFSRETFDSPAILGEKDELTAFKEAFERENPELAKTLTQEIQTTVEKRVIAVEQVFDHLNAMREKEPHNVEVKRDMERLAVSVSKDAQVMDSLKERSPEIKQQIDKITQQHEKQKERQLEKGFGLSL